MPTGDGEVVLPKMKLELRWAEIRFEEDTTRQSPGRIVGVLGVYGERASDRPEMVMAGAFTFPDGGVVVNRQHERKSPIVRVHPRIDGNVVRVDQPLLDTTAGSDAATRNSGRSNDWPFGRNVRQRGTPTQRLARDHFCLRPTGGFGGFKLLLGRNC